MQNGSDQSREACFENYYTITDKGWGYLSALASKQPKAMAILLFAFHCMDSRNVFICPFGVLQDELGISRPVVKRSIGYLIEHGFLYPSGPDTYIVNNTFAWKPDEKGVEDPSRCPFPADIELVMPA